MTIFKFGSLSFRFVKVSRSRENRWPSICPDHKGWVLFHKVSKSGTKKLRGAGEKTSCWIGFGNLVGISSNMKVGWKTASNQKRLEKGRDWVRGNRAALQQLCVSCYQQTSSCRALSSFFLPPIAPTEPSKANVLAYSASSFSNDVLPVLPIIHRRLPTMCCIMTQWIQSQSFLAVSVLPFPVVSFR